MPKISSKLAVFTAILTLFSGSFSQAQTASGSYLAALHAEQSMDFRRAAEAYSEAIFFDPDYLPFKHGAVTAYMALGDFDRAADIARDLLETDTSDPALYMAIVGDAGAEGNYEEITEVFAIPGQQLDQLSDGLIGAWALLGAGNSAKAMDEFDRISRINGLGAFGVFHKALALAWVGDFEQSEMLMASEELAVAQTLRLTLARAQVLSQLERNDEALQLMESVYGTSPEGEPMRMINALRDGKTLTFDLILSPSEGMSEVFYTLVDALSGEQEEDIFNLFYARLAEQLRPNHADALMLSAEILERLGLYDLSAETYSRVPKNSNRYFGAAIGIAETMREQGRFDASVAYLQDLSKDYGDRPILHITLGDHLRQMKNYKDAAEAYSQGIALLEETGSLNWYSYYVRGITYERLDEWDKSEADFRRSLELRPGQPQVLNYLGYSLVERREKLDEALSMIEQAVAERPDNGYIVDSLGWVLYRLGRYDEAVAPMELAAELMATDPIVNDHLGDVYWMVGRYLEAEFQWRRALSFDPEPEEADRIRRKLQVGLDQVLEEEREGGE